MVPAFPHWGEGYCLVPVPPSPLGVQNPENMGATADIHKTCSSLPIVCSIAMTHDPKTHPSKSSLGGAPLSVPRPRHPGPLASPNFLDHETIHPFAYNDSVGSWTGRSL